jgi:hypothetical protein
MRSPMFVEAPQASYDLGILSVKTVRWKTRSILRSKDKLVIFKLEHYPGVESTYEERMAQI